MFRRLVQRSSCVLNLCRIRCSSSFTAYIDTALKAIPAGCGRRAVVGLSGGVDSAVSAYLMKQAGYAVEGVFMRNWDEAEERGKECSTDADRRDVAKVARHLGIEWHEVDFVKEYWKNVFEVLLDGYSRGITPNPDVLCNQHIKFAAFDDYVQTLGVDVLATGHYARIDRSADGFVRLLRAQDEWKDQTYFLCMVPPERFARVIFPVGSLMKSAVKQIASSIGLPNAQRRESMGMCFVGKRNFGKFIAEYVQRPGVRLEDETGRHLGTGASITGYTVGQKARIPGMQHKYYVASKNAVSNCVKVVAERYHPALYGRSLTARDSVWMGQPFSGECLYRIRHQQPLEKCTVQFDDGELQLSTARPQYAIAPGQVVALYNDQTCLGGAIIQNAGPSLHELGETVPDATHRADPIHNVVHDSSS
eukprot:TRINITY_DN3663_c0_g1_i1.p1 TRINITY_DN3663_c0_g1~~TRINITY_DN3663_c0_g1_i1.p1  ORF type:complete len:420 (-),score=55.96 TRINITY_DN3663_c0_g1_i1:320-1579(-)